MERLLDIGGAVIVPVRLSPEATPEATSSNMHADALKRSATKVHEPLLATRLQLCTQDLPISARITKWQDLHAAGLFNIAVRPHPETPFNAEANILQLNSCAIATMKFAQAEIHLSKEQLRSPQATLTLIVVKAGSLRLVQRGIEKNLEAGQACLVLNNELMSCDILEPSHLLNIYVPIAALASLVPDLSRVVMQPLDRNAVALTLLTSYAETLHGMEGITTAFANTAANHLFDLIANAFENVGRPAVKGERDGIRAARRIAVKETIAANLTKHDLTPDEVSAQLGITPRYLRKLLQDEGTSFSDMVKHLRLQQAYALLREQRHMGRPISSIAYQVGFSDLSHFNRCFRLQFGMTPSEIRDHVVLRLKEAC